jgi:hypothetical protein
MEHEKVGTDAAQVSVDAIKVTFRQAWLLQECWGSLPKTCRAYHTAINSLLPFLVVQLFAHAASGCSLLWCAILARRFCHCVQAGTQQLAAACSSLKAQREMRERLLIPARLGERSAESSTAQ